MTTHPMNALVWSELPVSNLTNAIGFYNAVFDYDMEPTNQMGPEPVAIFPSQKGSASAHLYQTDQETKGGPTLHFQVKVTLEDAKKRVFDAGGTVLDMPEITIPQGKFTYVKDPDGNSLGLFEANA